MANRYHRSKLEKRKAVPMMLTNAQIVQAIINSYAIDGFVVVTDNTGVKTNELTDKSTGGKATIYKQFEVDKGGDKPCLC